MADLIKVTFPDGKQVCFRNPVNTVIEVLKWIGESRFHEITLENGGKPLVSQEIYPHLKNYQKEIVPGWYYTNRTDTREKTSQLININRALGLNLIIETSDEFRGERNPPNVGSTRPKNWLKVTLPDGEVIDYEGYRDVFMACIDKLGPRLISSKANFDLSSKCPLLTTTNTTGTRLKVADSLYLAMPTTTKEAAKILNLIALRLQISDKMKIEVNRVVSSKKSKDYE